MAESKATKFLQEWLIKCEAKKKNSTALSLEQYNAKVKILQDAESKSYKSKTSSEYRDCSRFVLVPGVNGSYKLAKQNKTEEDSFLYVVPK